MLLCLLGLVTCFMPWVIFGVDNGSVYETLFISNAFNLSTTRLYGPLCFALYMVPLYVLMGRARRHPFSRGRRLLVGLCGVGVLVVSIAFMANFTQVSVQHTNIRTGTSSIEETHFGSGIYLSMLCGLLIFLAAVVWGSRLRSSTPARPTGEEAQQ